MKDPSASVKPVIQLGSNVNFCLLNIPYPYNSNY